MGDTAILAAVAVFVLGKIYDIGMDLRARRNGESGAREMDRRLDAIDAGLLRLWERADRNTDAIADVRVSLSKCQAFHGKADEP